MGFYRAPQVPLPQGWQNRSLGHFQKGQNLTPTVDPNEPPPLLLSVSLTSDSLPQSGGGLNRPTQQHTSQVRGPWVFTWGGAWGVLGEPGLEKLKQSFQHSFSVFIIFVYTYFFLLLIVHTHAHPAAWRPEDSSRDDCFFPPCGLQGSNSGCHSWLQVPLPSEPSCWPHLYNPYWQVTQKAQPLRTK